MPIIPNLDRKSMIDITSYLGQSLDRNNLQNMYNTRPNKNVSPPCNSSIYGHSLRGWEGYDTVWNPYRIQISSPTAYDRRFYFFIEGGGRDILGFNDGVAENGVRIDILMSFDGVFMDSQVCSLRDDGDYSHMCKGETCCLLFDLYTSPTSTIFNGVMSIERYGQPIVLINGRSFVFDDHIQII